jgi:hypothetical protein
MTVLYSPRWRDRGLAVLMTTTAGVADQSTLI